MTRNAGSSCRSKLYDKGHIRYKNAGTTGDEKLAHRFPQVVEFAYQRVKMFERLSFLYLITGNRDKLRKMVKVSELRGEQMSRYQNAIYLGDIEEKIKTLSDVGLGW
jgi:coatomer protein complex subunit alpha (xenin)